MGWSGLQPVETVKYQQWWRSHGIFFQMNNQPTRSAEESNIPAQPRPRA
jgi:hypothetical protein